MCAPEALYGFTHDPCINIFPESMTLSISQRMMSDVDVMSLLVDHSSGIQALTAAEPLQ